MDKQETIEGLKQESRDLVKEGKIEQATKKFNEAWVLENNLECLNTQNIRPEIMEFAIAMEAEMARHDAEKGDSWKFVFMLADYYADKLGLLLGCLEKIKESQTETEFNEEILAHEAIDIANYCMMIWHKTKG
jgi:hypothetical protein